MVMPPLFRRCADADRRALRLGSAGLLRRSLPVSSPGWWLSSALRDWCSAPDAGWWCKVAESIRSRGLSHPHRPRSAASWPIGPASAERRHVGGRWWSSSRSTRSLPTSPSSVVVFDLRQSALVFALANICFALADTIFGQLDTIPSYLRLGRLEVLLVRPMPLLPQLVTSEVQMRRLGRLAVGVLIFLIVLPEPTSAIPPAPSTCWWSPRSSERRSMAPSSPQPAACSFSSTAASSPRHSFTAAATRGPAARCVDHADPHPVHFCLSGDRYRVPSVVVDHGPPGPRSLPAWLGWFAPVFAVWAWLLAWLAWRAGIRRFTGAGG